ncbi:hypothetical protein [Streptomyces sp. NRRL S-813]|uniref:hypothetical protein n=1 Tax=Streptomyces sp. NRRL S-813 TaxID=1463919 RepID=UPI0004C00E44|nr:hypothetical protein [Streptomyces sp. NRRL S-813]
MSTQADHGHELVPRPEQSPDALRAALAVVDPGRLPEMQQTKDEAFARAKNNLEHEDPAVATAALRELSAVLDEAMKAVRD